MLVKQFLLLAVILTATCSFKANNSPIVMQGDVKYSFESGKMQCQSEVDSEGHIFVLLKSLDKNTTVKFVEVTNSKHVKEPKFVVTAIMEVEEDTDLCASWKNIQAVSIAIDPLSVQAISLTGTQVYSSDQITIMTSNVSE